jgi:hypothetical protein
MYGDSFGVRFVFFLQEMKKYTKKCLAFSTKYLTNIFDGGIIFLYRGLKMKQF